MKRNISKVKDTPLRKAVSDNCVNESKALSCPVNQNKDPSIEEFPTKQQQYQLKQKVGQGAFAQVRLGKRISDGLVVVVKTYNKIKLYDQEKRRGVEQEISILSRVNHEGIIGFVDSYVTPTTINIVMQHFSTTSLRDYLKEEAKFSQQQLKTIIIQITSTLSYLHCNGIAHRDVKLQNILIDKKTLQIKLIDFGFAIQVKGVSRRHSLVGTPSYLSPEMIGGKVCDPLKADVWALGVLFYHLCAGYFPYRSVDNKVLQQKIVKGELLFPKGLNAGCEYLITRMLKKKKEQRVDIGDILNDTWVKPVNFRDQIDILISKMPKP